MKSLTGMQSISSKMPESGPTIVATAFLVQNFPKPRHRVMLEACLSTAASRAAKLVIESRDVIKQGRRRETQGAPPKPVSKAIQRHLGRFRQHGRPRLLSDDEDDAIAAFVIRLQRSGFSASKAQVEAAAQTLRQRRDPDAPPFAKDWYRRWLQDHPELRVTYIKAVEKSRKTIEAGHVSHVEKFFLKLREVIEEYKIGASEIWNEDECGIRIGSLRERIRVLVVRTTRHQRPQISNPGNRESYTIPPWLVFYTFPSESWAHVDAPSDVRFARSDTGFSNTEINASARAQRTGKTLSEWFGVDEWCRELEFPFHEASPRIIPKGERIHRLLVIDGFTGHTGLDFIQYCIKFDIIIIVLPPHSTHITQPLNVGVFQPLKHAQQKAIRKFVDTGELNFSRLDFLESFWETFTEGFTARYILSGFQKTGIFPPTPEPAVKRIIEGQLKLRQAVNPAYACQLPQETRFEQAVDTIRHVQGRYHEVFSSPTRSRLSIKMSSRLRRGKPVKAAEGTFYTSLSLEDVRQAAKRTIKLEEEKAHRKELLKVRSMIRQEKQKLLAQYRKEKVYFVNGKKKRYTIKQWLGLTGNNDEFLSQESSEDTFKRLFKRPGPFTIDKTRTPYRKVRTAAEQEAADEACASARPLQSMQWPHLQRERSVEIITTQPREPRELYDNAVIIACWDYAAVITASEPNTRNYRLEAA
ncbi:DDE superfamily endonuclease [Hirsutella rhossiliensis]